MMQEGYELVCLEASKPSRAEIKRLLGDSSYHFALGELFRLEREKSKGLSQMDLLTEEGRMVALREQGLLQGIAICLDLLTETGE